MRAGLLQRLPALPQANPPDRQGATSLLLLPAGLRWTLVPDSRHHMLLLTLAACLDKHQTLCIHCLQGGGGADSQQGKLQHGGSQPRSSPAKQLQAAVVGHTGQ